MTAPVAKKATAAELCAKFVDEWNTREHWDSGGVRMGADLDDLLAAARAEAVAEERARVGTMDADDSRTVAALMANPPAPSESLRRVLLGLGGEAVAPLEARVKELEGLVESTKADFRDMQILWERALDDKDRTRDVLRALVEQIGKSVGFPPPQSQCATGHAYSDFAQAINAALALLAADQAGEKAGKP